MQYKYETMEQDNSDLASGRVFYSLPGHPAFPVRLASEIFQRCVAHRKTLYQETTPCTLYDPCCGAAYHLTVVACLHRNHIREIIASDVDEKAVELARKNLGLLHLAGLDKRIEEITDMLTKYNKDSHREALKSAQRLRQKLAGSDQEHLLRTNVFQSSAMDSKTILKNVKAGSVDIVFSDIPYGQHSQWHDIDAATVSEPLRSMLDALTNILSPTSVVAITSDKGQKVSHERYQRIEHFHIGKRRVVLLRLIEPGRK